MQRVLPDSNVLLPVGLQNLFMRAQDTGFFHIVWSDELRDEYSRKLAEWPRVTPHHAHVLTERLMSRALGGRIDPSTYTWRIEGLSGRDPGDFAIAAAASVGADVLVTHNIRDFLGVVRPRCSVLDPDNFFTVLAREFPLEFVGIIQQTSTSLREPRTTREILEQLRASGLPQFHQLLEPYLAG